MSLLMKRTVLFLVALLSCHQSVICADTAESLSSAHIVQEIVSRSESPHAYDFRQATAEFMVGTVQFNEQNTYESSVFHLGVDFPTSGGHMVRLGINRVWMRSTSSSEKLGRTPFSQEALMTRYEFHFGYGYNLVEGRVISALSPMVADFETGFWAVGGLFYSHPNKPNMIERNDKPDPMPGQKRVNSSYNFNLGLLWKIYYQNGMGLYLEYGINIPRDQFDELKDWYQVAAGFLWSI